MVFCSIRSLQFYEFGHIYNLASYFVIYIFWQETQTDLQPIKHGGERNAVTEDNTSGPGSQITSAGNTIASS